MPRTHTSLFALCCALPLVLAAASPRVASARQPAARTDASDADRLRRAEAMATEAKALFRNRVFADAARLFMEAFALSKHATLVYNAARAYEEAGRLKRAESLFLLYASLPDADEAGKKDAAAHLVEVRRRIAAGEGEPDDPEPTPPPATTTSPAATAPTPAASTAAPPSTVRQAAPASRWPLWAGIGAGGVAAGLYGWAVYTASGLDLDAVRDDADRADYRARRDRASAMRWTGVAIGAGAAGLLIWSALRPDPAAATAGAVTLTPSLGAPGATLAIAF
ncbi:MAG: hypothetical protein RIT45_407 [Pseudomonadota bacterium]|jgi:tetratricopeptide (TPR) repeat protein